MNAPLSAEQAPSNNTPSLEQIWQESGLPTHTTDKDEGVDGQYLRDDTVVAGSKFRQVRIKSLDQMVDETDRLFRTYTDGQLMRWLEGDTSANIKVGMMIVQLRRLLDALHDIAQERAWPVDSQHDDVRR